MSSLLVILPTYNEAPNILKMIEVLLQLELALDVLVVDDNSPDGTGDLVEALEEERVFLLSRKRKEGLGAAYIAGFKWALNRNYRHICTMDADFSHDPADIPRLAEACEQGAHLAIGSRYIRGVNVVNWGMDRILLSLGASLYTRVITGMRVKDPTAGFVMYDTTVLREMTLDAVQFKGYAFQIEMKYKSHLLGKTLKEVSIVFKDREQGNSKMSSGIIKEAILGVPHMRLSHALGNLEL